MDEDVSLHVVADEEAETTRGIEPLHRTGDMEQPLVAACVVAGMGRLPRLGVRVGFVSYKIPARRHERPIHLKRSGDDYHGFDGLVNRLRFFFRNRPNPGFLRGPR